MSATIDLEHQLRLVEGPPAPMPRIPAYTKMLGLAGIAACRAVLADAARRNEARAPRRTGRAA